MNLKDEFTKLLEGQESILQIIKDLNPGSNKAKRMYSLQDAAELFGVTVRTIYNWKDSGLLPCTIIGSKTYLTEEQLDQFLAEHEVKPLKVRRN